MNAPLSADPIYETHETRNGAVCGDFYAFTKAMQYYKDAGRTDRVYHLCAFGPVSNPRMQWVNESNLRERPKWQSL